MEFELKPLSKDAIPGALERAQTYRLLNDPIAAESICRDAIAADPSNQKVIIELILSLTDQFQSGKAGLVAETEALASQMESKYHEAYYRGLINERRAVAQLENCRPSSGEIIYDWLRDAMHFYESAQKLQSDSTDNDESILRWNTCARLIMAHPSVCPADEGGSHEVHMFD